MDLNADVGEGYGRWQLGDDEAMLSVITSANVACGFHAGDPSTLRRVCALAAANGVRIGAQVSYPDLVGFGRRRMDVPASDLTNDVLYQLGALDAMARAAGSRVSYLRPHGALYQACMVDAAAAAAVVGAAVLFDTALAVYAMPGSQLQAAAGAAGLSVAAEAFADRAYLADRTLAPRSLAGAVVHDVEEIVSRAVQLATTGTLHAIDGAPLRIEPDTLCLHGDNPASVAAASAVRAALVGAGVTVTAFTAPPAR